MKRSLLEPKTRRRTREVHSETAVTRSPSCSQSCSRKPPSVVSGVVCVAMSQTPPHVSLNATGCSKAEPTKSSVYGGGVEGVNTDRRAAWDTIPLVSHAALPLLDTDRRQKDSRRSLDRMRP